MVAGGGAAWVLNEFPKELDACRRRHTRANTLLIVIIDADNNSVAQRLGQLQEKKEVEQDDPLVVLIPRRHGETWIRSALGQVVNENDDYTNPEPRKSEIRGAADQIHGWARNNPAPGHTCVDSLRHSLPAWRTIG